MSTFFGKFRRVTASTNYQPEIDGLRFLALFMVVVFLHITHYINQEFYNGNWIQNKYWYTFGTDGGNGVALFFIISGFILSLPFAEMHLNKKKRVGLKRYYLRRLTRLEPPYIIVLAILFAAEVYLLNKFSFSDAFPHFIASIFYVHNFVYLEPSTILPIAWSLEIEVQFYIVAPLLCCIFLIREKYLRWVLMLLIIVGGTFYWYNDWSVPHLLKYIHFFFAGIFFADLYVTRALPIKAGKPYLIFGLMVLAGFIFFNSQLGFVWYLMKMICMFLLFYLVLFTVEMKSVFSKTVIVIIGGMCYSIYLWHQAIISFAGKLIMKSGMDFTNTSYIPFFILLFSIVVLVLSSVYFLLVEKPFMVFNSKRPVKS
ncbi:MAG TPA: acyltransferase [Chitinophagaceae bacterium]|nr:acyltransferase [Chitinophagaceae bacterium]